MFNSDLLNCGNNRQHYHTNSILHNREEEEREKRTGKKRKERTEQERKEGYRALSALVHFVL